MKICVDPNGRIKLRTKQKYEIFSITICLLACKICVVFVETKPESNSRMYMYTYNENKNQNDSNDNKKL